MGENHHDEKTGQTSQVRGGYEGYHNRASTTSDRGSRSSSEIAQPVGEVGINGTNWPRRNNARGMLGGILAQLILDTQNQLGDARDSIAREQRKVEQLEERLCNLQQLQEMQKVETTEN